MREVVGFTSPWTTATGRCSVCDERFDEDVHMYARTRERGLTGTWHGLAHVHCALCPNGRGPCEVHGS